MLERQTGISRNGTGDVHGLLSDWRRDSESDHPRLSEVTDHKPIITPTEFLEGPDGIDGGLLIRIVVPKLNVLTEESN